MRRDLVDWEEIGHLAKVLGGMGPEFTPDDKKALTYVFEVARKTLTGERDAVPLDARFIPGPDIDETRELFKIEGLFRGDPPDDPDKGRPEPKSAKS